MFVFLVGFISLNIGFAFGAWWKGTMFDNRDWQILRWDSGIFAYRLVPKGALIVRGDKIMMACDLNTEVLPDTGIRYE
jgi:hypothetical protein